jgi:hypothetical protein
MDVKMEKNRKENRSFDQTGDKYYEYLREMKKEQSEDSDYSATFMTF